jgi:serine/threonine protein kinase
LTLGNIEQIKSECNSYIYLVKFVEEAETMNFFKNFPGCRVRTASDVFKYDETNTCYYVMDYYSRGTLLDEIENNGLLTEHDAIERIMIPLARAVKTMHDNGWLHLDIKAENVLIDDDGLAVLGDLGISQHWDENGNKTTKGVSGIGSQGASKRQKTNDDKFASEFHPEQDVYSLAALYYLIITGNAYHRDFEPEDLEEYDISEESKAAITAALVGGDTLETTPKDVLEFMRMLPGCQDLELPVIQPACMEDNESIDFDDWDFDMDDLDLPDFNTDDLPTSPGSASTY